MTAMDKAGRWQCRAGFTLVELLIALVVMAVIAAVAVPAYTSKVRQARQVNAQRILTSLAQTAEIYRFQNENYTNFSTAAAANLGWANDSDTNQANAQWYPTANIVINTGINNPPANPNPPPDGTGALGPWFHATATGTIGGAQPDIWAVTNNSSPTNTQKGF